MFNPYPKPTSKKKKKKKIGPGKRTIEWEKAKQHILNPAFAQVGLLYACEVGAYLIQFEEHEQVKKHRHNFALSYAHGKKRRKLVNNELVTFVARCCNDCHDYIEYRPDMKKIIEAVISSRAVQPASYYLQEGR